MSKSIKIKLAQINFTVGDLAGNFEKIKKAFEKSKDEVDLIIFSELALTGYFPEDLLYKSYFIENCEEKIRELTKLTEDSNCAILLGAPYKVINKHNHKSLYNAGFLLEDGHVSEIACKSTLPNYGVFDEKRYFKENISLSCIEFRGLRLAILICEDIWNIKNSYLLADKNLDAIISINASPFTKNKIEARLETIRKFIKDLAKPVIYLNQIGLQDSILFDGSSMVVDGDGKIKVQLSSFYEDDALIELKKDGRELIINNLENKNNTITNEEERLYTACVLAVRDYIRKNGFSKVVLGMSGGIDSALVATIAVDALGSENVKLVALPSKFTSNQSLKDAEICSKNLGINLDLISIENIFENMLTALSQQFEGLKPDTTEENLQARIRGNLLMALSNKFGHLLLTTGNKSEMAVGYATLYGDMCGAFNPIKDLYKTQVYRIVKWRNNHIPKISSYPKINLIPDSIINKAPTAELRFDQKDSDSLPEYNILDQILHCLIEEQKSVDEIIELGFEEKIVKKVAKLFYSSEYKRYQAPIGPKLSTMSFDRDRRYPITNKFWN